ncbi:MAG TPA: hypothetical protein VFP50_15260 [Anaeromyxobacteraceae bacterium]|nr:hypothetical protein [Anaeromyxobacteraceae bacterium]
METTHHPEPVRRHSRPALALAARERDRALRAVQQLIECALISDEPDRPMDERGRIASAVNASLRKLYAGVLALHEGPTKKTRHQWRYDVAAGLDRCTRCPLTRERKSTSEGVRYVYARGGEVVAIGPATHAGAPRCERAKEEP